MTKIIHLNALNLDVEVQNNVYFQDLGVKKCLSATYREICRRHKTDINPEEEEDLLKCRGVHLFLKHEEIISEEDFLISRDTFYSYIFYRELFSQTRNLITRAHEETHFIEVHNNLPLLSSEVKRRVGVNIDFERLEKEQYGKKTRKEIIAEIGARFAIHQRYGFKLLEKENGFTSNKYAFEAWKIYRQAYQDSLKLSRKQNRQGLAKILNLLD